MTTRGSIARGQGAQQVFTGRVRKWRREWVPVDPTGQATSAKLLKWVASEERFQDSDFPRFAARMPLEKIELTLRQMEQKNLGQEKAGEGAGLPNARGPLQPSGHPVDAEAGAKDVGNEKQGGRLAAAVPGGGKLEDGAQPMDEDTAGGAKGQGDVAATKQPASADVTMTDAPVYMSEDAAKQLEATATPEARGQEQGKPEIAAAAPVPSAAAEGDQSRGGDGVAQQEKVSGAIEELPETAGIGTSQAALPTQEPAEGEPGNPEKKQRTDENDSPAAAAELVQG